MMTRPTNLCTALVLLSLLGAITESRKVPLGRQRRFDQQGTLQEDEEFWNRWLQRETSLDVDVAYASTNTPTATPPTTLTSSPTVTPSPTPKPTHPPISDTTIVDMIQSTSRFDGLEFEDPESYQSRALDWVVTNTPSDPTAAGFPLSPQKILQRYALACLYYSTFAAPNSITGLSGDVRGWIDATGWLVFPDECSWYQVACNDFGYVTKIELYSNRLTGSLPYELALLQDWLTTLDVYQNILENSGAEGHAWLGELHNLQYLFYGRTFFQNDNGIPSVIGTLTRLKEYDCSYVLYDGPLDGSTFVNLTNLEYMDLSGNRYNSGIPSQLASLPQLQFLYGVHADLTGSLDFVLDMPAIIELWVDNNPIMTGTIPSSIEQVSTLVSLGISNCSLTGTLPPFLGDEFVQFFAHDNALTGTIPAEWGALEDVKRIELHDNLLVGTMPDEVCDLREAFRLVRLTTDCQRQVGTVACDCCTCCGPSCSFLQNTDATAEVSWP
ncbi:Receptor-like kinase [Seminavis robusta]|uniref:Receptor-like kinase n=1 Tax=Seminavis robusta TaxID=568900 RepID=A0A9N8H6P2_9STRA|nr:Receptor-like kinase [Seminavis robusta]|eukprot:Sro177_g077680.1 Receptor-like kinase (497) ;mRNA; f:26017-27507